MKSFSSGLGIVVASLTLATAPAFAQKPESGGSPAAGAVDRASGGGAPSGGGAVDRGSGGSVATSSGSSGTSTSVSSSSPSAGAASSSSVGFSGRAMREYAPEHRAGFAGARATAYDEGGQKATPRSSGPSGGGGGSAVSRGGGSASGGSSASAGTRTAGRERTGPAPEASAGANNASGTREVPSWSRPRGDRPTTGTAVDRTTPPPDRNGNNRDRYGYGGFYDPYGYYGYGGYNYGYGYGYDGLYYPYGFGMGYGLYSGFGWAPYYGDAFGDPYGGGYGYGGGASTSYGRGEQGNLKLKVKPRAAKVYVDGYFVGPVDQFDGALQKLALNTGRHKVEIKADGFETAEFDVLINPEQTVTFQGELKRIQ
jgi:hypothetical protein